MNRHDWKTFGAAALAAAAAACGSAAAADVELKKTDIGVAVQFDGEPFTEYRVKETAKPVLYPVIGPHGVRMTRDYPFKKDTHGEASDHPHHESLWFTHGDVNGISFWHLGDDAGAIVHDAFEKVEGDTIVARNKWIGPDGKVVLTDTQTLRFGGSADARFIDYAIELHAPESHDVVFGDTKEGTMGIRTHPNLRLKNDEGRGVTTANGHALNSAGDKDGDLWGKNAAWVDYWGDIDGKTVGVAIFDHPSNPRHPTTWHARDYGLIAANPFGLHDFQKKPAGAGNLTIAAGESAAFRYRFVFHEGDAESAGIPARYKEWAAE